MLRFCTEARWSWASKRIRQQLRRDSPYFATAKELLDSESYTKENCRRDGKVWYLNIAALMS